MVRGLYTAATGALVAQANVDTIANNLANASTSGFKRTLLQVESYAKTDIYRNQTDPGKLPNAYVNGVPAHQLVGSLGSGSYVYDTPAQFDQGAIQQTGNPLDLALSGGGFFTVRTPQNQLAYTRAGSFVVGAQGQLTTTRGDAVLDTQGNPVTINPQNGAIQIDKQGNVTQAGSRLAQLGITEFGNTTALRPQGDTNFVDTGANPSAATGTTVIQGAQEASNANVVRSMVDLISNQRWFEANIKMIQTQDSTMQAAITTVGHSSSN